MRCCRAYQRPATAQVGKALFHSFNQPQPWAFVHDAVGLTDKLPNLHAELGVVQPDELCPQLDPKLPLAQHHPDVFLI